MEKHIALNSEEAARVLGCNKRTLDNWRGLGKGPKYFKISKRLVRYSLEDLLIFRDGKRVEPMNN